MSSSAHEHAGWVHGRYPIAGADIGILVLRTCHPLVPGNIQNASSFRYPVFYEIVDITDPLALMRGEPSLEKQIVAGAQNLVERGAKIIAGACGSFAYYQKAVASSVPVPVFLSIMLVAPLLLSSLGSKSKALVVCSAASALNPRVFEQCGITGSDRLVIRDMQALEDFRLLIKQDPGGFNTLRFEREVVQLVSEAVDSDPEIKLVLLQCSDTPPYAAAISKAVGLPVAHMGTFIDWLSAIGTPPVYG